MCLRNNIAMRKVLLDFFDKEDRYVSSVILNENQFNKLHYDMQCDNAKQLFRLLIYFRYLRHVRNWEDKYDDIVKVDIRFKEIDKID